jgi:hypothetical protein
MEECGILMEFTDNEIAIENTYQTENARIELKVKDLDIIEKMIAEWKAIKKRN